MSAPDPEIRFATRAEEAELHANSLIHVLSRSPQPSPSSPAARRHTANCDTSHGFRPGHNPLKYLDALEKPSNQVLCLPDARPACRIISLSPNVWAASTHSSSAVTPPRSSVASLSNCPRGEGRRVESMSFRLFVGHPFARSDLRASGARRP